MEQPYRKRHPDGPFVTLVTVAATCLHPEADGLGSLRRWPRQDDPEMRVFKAELREAVAHAERLPGDKLFDHVEYDDGSDEACLQRLWRDLYGAEPVTEPEQA